MAWYLIQSPDWLHLINYQIGQHLRVKASTFLLMCVLHTIYDMNILFYAINPIKHTFSNISTKTRLLLCVSRKARKTSGMAMRTTQGR